MLSRSLCRMAARGPSSSAPLGLAAASASGGVRARVPLATPAFNAVPRRHASLQEFAGRIATVENVEKITSTLKMVAASKLKLAQRKLEPAQAFADTVDTFFADLKAGELSEGDESGAGANAKHMIVVAATDRGMCGALNNNVVRTATELAASLKDKPVEFVSLGSKGADGIASNRFAKNISLVALEIGQKPTTFAEIAYLAEQVLKRPDIASVRVIYNKFFNLLKNEQATADVIPLPQMKASAKWEEVEDEDDDMYRSLSEFHFASLLWRAVHENQTCEHAVRMTSMDGASSNAGELLDDLKLEYNKARQAAITQELGEIVGGMSAILG